LIRSANNKLMGEMVGVGVTIGGFLKMLFEKEYIIEN
jgi:hypothetical protein